MSDIRIIQEEPTVSLYLEDETLAFLKPCFDYDPINRPKARWNISY